MTPILKNNIQIYFILVNVIIILIYTLTILLIIMSYKIKNNQLNNLWAISILKFCLPFFSVCFFGQSFLLLTTIFDCQNGFSYVSKLLICRTGIWFNIDAPLAGIAIILHFFLALITNILYYKSTFVKNGSDVLKKTNCIPDVVLLFTKIFVIIIFILDNGEEDEHWTLLFFLIVVTGINAFCNFYYQNRQNRKLSLLNNILCLMPFLGFCSLLIGKIFQFLGFNGAIFLFFSWIIFAVIFLLFYKKKDIEFAYIDHKEINNPRDYINYIHRFYKIVLNKNNSRNDYTILKSLIEKKEEKCCDSTCPLKKYNEHLSNEIDDIFPLLQFCEKLFKYGIAKFSNDISLKINYSMFLIFEMNYNKKALITLNSIDPSLLSFQDNYNIYRCQKLIDEYIANKNKNIIHSLEYKKMIQDFKLIISKASSLYYDFWSLIAINKLNVSNNLDDLNKIGSEIIDLNKKIEEEYDMLIKTKSDNYDLIKFYSYFKENVLNHEKQKKIKIKDLNSSHNYISDSQDIQFSNFDINVLKENDLLKYIIISGNKKNFAQIIELSTNICPIFGYDKHELLGKNVNFLIPELYHNAHDISLLNFNEKVKSIFYKQLFTNDDYFPEYIEKYVYGISKSKFLLKLKLKVYFVQTEGNEFVYIVEVTKIKDFQENIEMNNVEDLKCTILTDENFYIQSFTPNCVSYLKLNDFYINSNYNIMNYIKQLKNDYLKKINEITKGSSLNSNVRNNTIKDKSDSKSNLINFKINSDKISYTEKKKIKRELIENKYLGKKEITWRINLNNNNNIFIMSNDESIFKHSLISTKDNNNFLTNNKKIFEKEFTMEVKKIIINNELIGYYFIFDYKINELHNIKNFMSFDISDQKANRRQSIKKQKKYKYLLKVYPKELIKKQQTIELLRKEKVIKRSQSPKKKIIKFKSLDKNNFTNYKKQLNNSPNKNQSSKHINLKYNTDISNEDTKIIEINEEYIPKYPFNFIFDVSNRFFKPAYDIKKKEKNQLNEILKLQAFNKINYLKNNNENKNDKNKSYELNESEESEYEENEENDSSSSNSYSQNLKIQKYSSLKINREYNNNENKSQHQKNKQVQNKNDILNSIYKVNLNKIRFSIYDFNKDMVIELNIEKTSKVESIIKNPKSRFSIEIKNINEYTNNLFNSIMDNKKKDSSLKNNNKNTMKNEKMSEDKILENKIMEAINKEYDEENDINIHKYSLLYLLTLIVCSSIYLYFEISLYSDLITFLDIIKNFISINYSNKIGLYFIRELTLLNIPDTGIKGGQYVLFPASNKAEYISLVKKNILELFVESQVAMSDFIGTSFSISETSNTLLTQTKLVNKLSNYDSKSTIIKNNIIINLVQLNSAQVQYNKIMLIYLILYIIH